MNRETAGVGVASVETCAVFIFELLGITANYSSEVMVLGVLKCPAVFSLYNSHKS